jgi:hypothetical protein
MTPKPLIQINGEWREMNEEEHTPLEIEENETESPAK